MDMNSPLCVTRTSVFTHTFFLVSYIAWGLTELKNSPFTYNCFHLLLVFQVHLGFHPGIWSSMWLHLLLYPDLRIFFQMWLHLLLHSGKLCSWKNFQEFLPWTYKALAFLKKLKECYIANFSNLQLSWLRCYL